MTLSEFGDIQHDNTSRPGLILARILAKVDLPKGPVAGGEATRRVERPADARIAGGTAVCACGWQELQERVLQAALAG